MLKYVLSNINEIFYKPFLNKRFQFEIKNTNKAEFYMDKVPSLMSISTAAYLMEKEC